MFWKRRAANARRMAALAEAQAEANSAVRRWLLESHSVFVLIPEKVIFQDGPNQLQVRIYSRRETDSFLITYAFACDQISDDAVKGLWMFVGDSTVEVTGKSGQFRLPALGELVISAEAQPLAVVC